LPTARVRYFRHGVRFNVLRRQIQHPRPVC
jgi:hypothetical protein